jgi:1-acyl-sn-glycerol-3-phosphate acyltransferase
MNYMSEKLKQAENNLKKINIFSLQSVYLVSEGKDLDQALVTNEQMIAKVKRLEEKGIVKKYSGVSSLVFSDSLQKARIQRWNLYWTRERKETIFTLLEKEGTEFKFRAGAFGGFRNLLDKNFTPVDSGSMNLVRKTFVDDYISEKPGIATVVTLLKVTPENKQEIYQAFENIPSVTVLDRQYLTNKFIGLINADFSSIAWMSSILVFTVLLLTYGRIELTLVSFIPMFVTFIWILGIMGILGVQFNIINIIISAFIFGLGDDYSLFIMDGLLQEYKTGRKNLASYKSSIILSAITTIAGLGVLIFAKHPALRSIAIISIVGIACVVVMSQILIPFLYSTLIGKRTENNRFPWTLSGFLKSAFAFTYFAVGSLLMTLVGFLLVRLNPFDKERGKYIYHFLISKYCWSLMYIMVNVKKKIINPAGENFSRQAIVICNHQSFLDILVTVMLYPRLILFTNHWVWNSPVFGAVVRMADYYPIIQGVEGSLELLESRVRQGYSIVVFPEGTRSADGNMRRFHKGAFFLAEKLGLDILPIMIHGTGYTMTKGDFLLKDGKITLKFLPRISSQDNQFGTAYAERAKLIGKYFRQEYSRFRLELERPGYYREQLIYNYIYKGPVIEWYMKVKLRLEGNYEIFHHLLPRRGQLIDIGCGFGFLSYMLHFASGERKVTGIDHDEAKTEVANCCFSRDDEIRFVYADINSYPVDKCDGIVLSDVLHYLQPAQQEALLEKCIASLVPGGVIVIRDANTDLPSRHQGTRVTEFFSTRFFGFNKTNGNGLSFFSAKMIRDLAVEKDLEYSEIDTSKYTSNQIHVIRKRQVTIHESI